MNTTHSRNNGSLTLCSEPASPPRSNGHDRRILFTCWDFRIGGVCSYTVNQARAFRRRGYHVGAIVPEPFGQMYPDFLNSLDFVEIVRRGLESRRSYLRRLTRRIIAAQPSVLINSAVPMVQAVLPYLPAPLIRISMVHSIMDLETSLALANSQWVDWVVAVSDGARRRVEKDNSGQVQCVTIPVGLEMPPHKRIQDRAASPLRLIYVGRISPEKNLPGLLRILTALRDADIAYVMTIVGDGEDFQAVTAEARSLHLERDVRFLGMQPPSKVHRLLDGHDFLLMTSHFEGTPHAALEAMAHGLVVVAPLLPGSTDQIITHGADGFLCASKTPAEYVGILETFVREPGRFQAVSKAAQETAASRYTTDAIATHYEPLLKRGPVRSHLVPKKWTETAAIPGALQTNFPGLMLQGKHLAADFCKSLVHGRRPVPATIT